MARSDPFALVLSAACAACSASEPPLVEVAPRPVSVIELRERDPVEPLLLTGSVESWMAQDVAFEVEGRVEFVVGQTTNLEGRWLEDGEVTVEGDVLARIAPLSYDIAVDQAAAAIRVAQEELQTARVQREKVLPANLAASLAERDRAQAEFVRFEQAAKTGAVAGIDLIRAQADRDAGQARYDQSAAAMDSKDAEIQALVANTKAQTEDARQAQYDRDRCTLYAPFNGEVAEVYIEAGGYARRGEPVARLVMMTPIMVDLAVSPATAASLRTGDYVRIHLPQADEPARGRVYEMATTADPETRTFRISIITMNERRTVSFPEGDPRASLPRITQTMNLVRGDRGQGGPGYFAESQRALRQDEAGWYVWCDPVYGFGQAVTDGTLLDLRKFRVVPGERRYNFQGLYLVRELTDIGELQEGAAIALDVPDVEGDRTQVVVAQPIWTLRPGQLVQVLLSNETPAPGLYLPMDAIVPTSEARGVVFVVDGERAKRIEVTLHDNVGDLFRVEGEGLGEGQLVITDYIHFLQDGERVRVTSRGDRS